ncbi:MAG: acetyl/propionyl-CoA carboxylase alpha subunit [Planctomycetota bacterium]|jgi:acetyl/propionyl-CoA carboxylase alpha subunit
MKSFHLKIGGKDYAFTGKLENGQLVLKDEDGQESVFTIQNKDGELLIKGADGMKRLFMARNGEDVWVTGSGEPYAGQRFHPEAGSEEVDDASAADIIAPMTGRVVAVKVEQGQDVAVGDTIAILEAMKMEHKMTAPFAAKVETLSCEEGQQVDMHQVLAHLVRLEQDS